MTGAFGARLGLRSLLIVLVAALAQSVAPANVAGLPDGLVGVAVALAGILVMMPAEVKASGVLFLVVFASSFVDYALGLRMRFTVAGVPINVVDLSFAVAAPTLIIVLFRSRDDHANWRAFRMTVMLAVLVLGLLPAFIHGVLVNGWYSAYRDYRVIVFVALSYLLMRKRASDPRVWQAVIHTILMGGIYAMMISVALRVRGVGTVESYDELRGYGGVPASMEFASVLVLSFIVCGQTLFRRKWPLWVVVVLWIAGSVFQLSLTAYVFVILIPLLCLALAPISRRRKAWFASIMLACAFVAALLAGFFLRTSVGKLVDAVVTDPRHVGSRRIAWEESFKLLDGPFQLLTGIGMGTRKFVPPELGGFVIGEPTYSTYLIGAGLIGVMILVALQLNFLVTVRQYMRRSGSGYARALRLALLVYGVLTMINCVLHNTFMSPQLSSIYGVLLAIGAQPIVVCGDVDPRRIASGMSSVPVS